MTNNLWELYYLKKSLKNSYVNLLFTCYPQIFLPSPQHSFVYSISNIDNPIFLFGYLGDSSSHGALLRRPQCGVWVAGDT